MLAAGFIFSWFFSCSPRISPTDAPIPEPETFSITGTTELSDKWWEHFKDPVLESLVEQGLKQNLELAGNWEQFRAALAVVDRESSFLWPQIDATAGTAVSRPQDEFSRNEDFRAGLSASYELDLWGRLRAAVQAEEFRAQATLLDYQAAAMSVSAEISITWFRLLSARKQLELADEQIETNQDIMRLIRARFTGGQIRAVDILRQEQLLESTRNEKIFYETQIGVLKNQLAVLLGQPPQNIDQLTEAALPEIPPLPDSGLPLELVRRRPDLKRSYNIVLAADREMAVAIRSKYPRISLDAVGQAQGDNFNTLFKDWAYTLAGNLVGPLFYGGRLNAEVDRTEALKNSTLYQYGQDVLVAFREVENALLREQKQNERILLLERRLDLFSKTNRQLKNEFLNGMTDYLEVLLSLDQEQQLQREMIQAQQERLEYRIALYRALAGGFETERMENINTGS